MGQLAAVASVCGWQSCIHGPFWLPGSCGLHCCCTQTGMLTHRGLLQQMHPPGCISTQDEGVCTRLQLLITVISIQQATVIHQLMWSCGVVSLDSSVCACMCASVLVATGTCGQTASRSAASFPPAAPPTCTAALQSWQQSWASSVRHGPGSRRAHGEIYGYRVTITTVISFLFSPVIFMFIVPTRTRRAYHHHQGHHQSHQLVRLVRMACIA